MKKTGFLFLFVLACSFALQAQEAATGFETRFSDPEGDNGIWAVINPFLPAI